MALKPGGKTCHIKEQIIEDLVTGLTLQFSAYDNEHGGCKLTIYGDILPFGNRDIIFSAEGKEAAGGTATTGCPSPSWLKEVKQQDH